MLQHNTQNIVYKVELGEQEKLKEFDITMYKMAGNI